LKSKKVLSLKGEHQTAFGEESRKYWFSPDEIGEVLKPNISEIQAERLSLSDRELFDAQARLILERFGYIAR
jgi:hypothetical protein